MEKESKFKRELIWFDKRGYDLYNRKGKDKLILLAKAVAWASKYIKNINSKTMVKKGFEIYFLEALQSQNTKLKSMGIQNPYKIVELLDIPLNELKSLEKKYEDFSLYEIEFKGNKALVKSNKESFCKYTKNESENEKLKVANKLINAIKEVSKHNTIQPLVVCRSFNGFINYNWDTLEYGWNHNLR